MGSAPDSGTRAEPRRPILHLLTVGVSGLSKPMPDPRTSDGELALHHPIAHDGSEVRKYARDKPWDPGQTEPCAIHLRNIENNRKCLLSTLKSLDPQKEVARRGASETDYLPAEISALQIFYANETSRAPEAPSDRVCLLATQSLDGWIAADIIRQYIVDKCRDDADGPRPSFAGWVDPDDVQLHVIAGLQPHSSERFEKSGLPALVQTVEAGIQAWRTCCPGGRVVINLTGGLKGAIPHLVLVAACEDDVEVQYLYEDSPDLITLPTMPLAWDLAGWRDNRGVLRVLPKLQPAGRRAVLPHLPPRISSLFTPDEASPNVLYAILGERYEKAAVSSGGPLTPYGSGLLLLDLVEETSCGKLLSDHIGTWQHAWLGDQVPEMAEHQRGHTQRLLELAAQALYPALHHDSDLLDPTEIAVLIAAIWLHDIGHAGRRFYHGNRRYVVDGFPTLVRDWHHLLAAQMLQDDIQALSDGRDGAFFKRDSSCDFVDAVRLVAKHHRSSFPLDGLSDASKSLPGGHAVCAENPDEDAIEVGGEQVRWRLLTGLFRIIDSTDVQQERAGIAEYRQAREGYERGLVRHLLSEAGDMLKAPPGEAAESCVGQYREWVETLTRAASWDGFLEVCDSMDDTITAAVNELCGGRTANDPSPAHTWCGRVLSLLSSAVFKARQPKHLRKHAGIATTAILYREDGCHHLTPYIYYKRDANLSDPECGPMKAAADICDEYKGVKRWLDDACIEIDAAVLEPIDEVAEGP